MRKLLFFIALISWNTSFSQTTRVVEFLLPKSETNLTLDAFKFYITNVSLTYSDGTEFTPKEQYFLVDIEQKSSMTIPLDDFSEKNISELRYTIGTDSLLNTSGNFDGVLDPINGMYWAWNSGYINFKLEGNLSGTAFEYHIGGYLPPYSTSQTVSFKFSENPKKIPILIDLETFIKNTIIRKTSILTAGAEAQDCAKQFKSIFSCVQ